MGNLITDVPTINVLGTRVHAVGISDIVVIMGQWIDHERQWLHHVVNTGMHGIMEGHRDPAYRTILNKADLLAPDGILVLLIARLRGINLRKSDTGPDLMWRFSSLANRMGYKYYMYGDSEDTLQLLNEVLVSAFPDIQVVGFHSPPFRPLTAEEDDHAIADINLANPDVLWIGLGTPKQERWIAEHRDRLNVPVVIGVGATFKFSSGKVMRAPAWLRNSGFEWLWRLLREPMRVWRRVIIDAPLFIGLVLLELMGLKKFG